MTPDEPSERRYRVAIVAACPFPALQGSQLLIRNLAHGLGAVKEMYLEPFARRFAEAGIAALVFDYRSFGASGGSGSSFPVFALRISAK